MTLAKGVCGVVTRDAKGSGQGTITVTDGNSLEVPLDARFPKVGDITHAPRGGTRNVMQTRCTAFLEPRLG